MPRLAPSTPTFGSPNRDAMPFGESSSNASTSSSVRLSCLSPSGRAVHSLAIRDSVAYIDSHSLPLVGTVEADNTIRDGSMPAVVRTSLPERVRSALDRYPAVELLCVDVDSPSPTKQGQQHLPRLCLYTKKDTFLFQLGYTASGASEVEGVVLSIKEPFEEVLIGTSTSTSIIRIRQAPQQHMGHVTICPPECMAMLTHDSTTNEYSLTLYHGTDDLGTPQVYGMEQLEDQVERITDFCFCQSTAFSLLSSLTVALLKGSGDVLFATPILFRGTVVPKGTVTKTLAYLDAELKRTEPSSAKWRQLRIAKQYILDAFPNEGHSHFLTAQERSDAFGWPVQMQGPVLVAPETDDFESSASAIEPVIAGDLVGVAIGHLGRIIEFGVISPTTLIPRFKFESEPDTHQLDNDLKWGAIVNRVDLRDDEMDRQPVCASLALIRDPIMDTVVHYVTPTGIQSISTNTVKITANKVRAQAQAGVTSGICSPPSKRKDALPRTTAWSCIDVSSMQNERNSVAGAVVSGDVHLGHVLVSRLSNGSMVALNLTETRQLQEIEALGDNDQLTLHAKSTSSGDRELEALQDTSPLVDVVDPLVKQVISGLSGMGKVVGTSTPTAKITPNLLAAAVSIKERCDNEILLPILEMNEHVLARRKGLAIMLQNQLEQLKTLKGLLAKLNERNNAIHERMEVVQKNAKTLAERSTSVLQSSTDLSPTITQTEYDYFQELKRLDAKTKGWQQELDRLNVNVAALCTSIDNGTTGGPMHLPAESMESCFALLRGSEVKMNKQKTKLKDAEDRLDELAAVAGFDRNPDGHAGKLQ